ncbi:hypothetical protein LNP59_16820 [Klebsiella pneumoniae subsp. pneumoniae]|nr:hypothetical protein [Klebsiella pneumoniae subsp. pneumoniae]
MTSPPAVGSVGARTPGWRLSSSFNIAPALFRFGRQAVAGGLAILHRFRFFFLMMRNEIEATDKGHQHSRRDRHHRR